LEWNLLYGASGAFTPTRLSTFDMVMALHRKELLTGSFIQESQMTNSGTLRFVLHQISPCPYSRGRRYGRSHTKSMDTIRRNDGDLHHMGV
jgi:hypothetical protein